MHNLFDTASGMKPTSFHRIDAASNSSTPIRSGYLLCKSPCSWKLPSRNRRSLTTCSVTKRASHMRGFAGRLMLPHSSSSAIPAFMACLQLGLKVRIWLPHSMTKASRHHTKLGVLRGMWIACRSMGRTGRVAHVEWTELKISAARRVG